MRAAETSVAAPWQLNPAFEFARERLQYLVWSNNYDCRGDEPIWWHGRRAERLGATAVSGGPGDVLLGDGTPAWCDGGPRQPLTVPGDLAVVHRETIEAGSLTPDRYAAPTAQLAPDQLAAVSHTVGPARIIAPAGSGKTRVLTERLRHLVADRGVTPTTVTAVAYNKRAADELTERTADLPVTIRTLNSLGLAIVNAATAGRRDVVEEIDVRSILESLLHVRRQANTDPWPAYIEALRSIRLGLHDPADVEAALPDTAGIADVFEEYRAILRARHAVDFDEQIYGAVEVLLREPDVRAQFQPTCRHLLVDEFQDLTPAHLLMLRLLAAPTYDVFGVGDDDQVIYGYADASPEFLIDYERYFPGATPHALTVNYRCPPAVIDGARHLLSYNDRRIAKKIDAAPARAVDPAALSVVPAAEARQASVALARLQSWADEGVPWSSIAVLSRVNAALLAVQVQLVEADVPCDAPLGPRILNRTGIRAALAYLRMGLDPARIRRADIAETIRRPSRRIARNVAEMLQRRSTTSLHEIWRLSGALSGGDVAKVEEYAADLQLLTAVLKDGDTAAALRAIRVDVGLGSAMDLLDSSRNEADRSTHGDDLAALEQVAALHPDPATFEPWLRDVLGRPGSADGVTLSTVHRVKGREWPNVLVFAANEGLFPHRLATDEEEERRAFHVAITRGRDTVVVLAGATGPTPFAAELTGDAPRRRANATSPSRREARMVGHAKTAPPAASAVAEGPVIDALRAWRKAVADRDRGPAYVVFSNKHLDGIAAAAPSTLEELRRCPGVGPAKLDRYGDELLAVLDGLDSDNHR